MIGSMLHRQEAERSVGIARHQDLGHISFLSCKKQIAQLKAASTHSGGTSLGMMVYDCFLCSLNPHRLWAIPGETESLKIHGLHWAAKGDLATECDSGLIQK